MGVRFNKRRYPASSSPDTKGGYPEDFEFLESSPALLEFLAETEWSEGVSRVPGSLTIFIEDNRWKCCLSDKDGGAVAFLSADTHAQLLASIEKGLREDRLDWRASRPANQKVARKT